MLSYVAEQSAGATSLRILDQEVRALGGHGAYSTLVGDTTFDAPTLVGMKTQEYTRAVRRAKMCEEINSEEQA